MAEAKPTEAEPRLADTFHARRITVKLLQEDLGTAINRCMELGLFPNQFEYLDRNVTFCVQVPQVSFSRFERIARDFGCAVIQVLDEQLLCPPAGPSKDRICVRDTVVWNETAYPSQFGDMKRRYGDGPFRVIGIHLSSDELSDASAPGMFTIEFYKEEGGYDSASVAGTWFKKPQPPA